MESHLNKRATLIRVAFFRSLAKDYPLLNTPTFKAIASVNPIKITLCTLFPPKKFGLLMSNVPFIIFYFKLLIIRHKCKQKIFTFTN